MEKYKRPDLEIKREEEKKGFEYSVENPPPLEVLESKVFAVHATSVLPENGMLIAGAQDINGPQNGIKEEPPSFRPTIHFSLGELVQSHQSSWEGKPYAVISSLKDLKKQLINVFPHDTFVLGNVPLQKSMVLLVPTGTDVSKLPPEITIKEYDQKEGLRKAVDQAIEEKDGWHFQMKPEGVAIGSVAYIEGEEINDAQFFQSLLEEYPYISFGTHIDPECGDAFRFGHIEQALFLVMRGYGNYGLKYNTAQVLFHRSVVLHHLERLKSAIENSSIDPRAIDALNEKEKKLFGWLNIINCDVETRQKFGKTFTGAPKSIQIKAREMRNDPEKLKEFAENMYLELPDTVDEDELLPSQLALMVSGMSFQELEQFKDANEEVFNHINLAEFYAVYATHRWIIVKNKQAGAEGLEQLLENSLAKITEKPKQSNGILNILKDFLHEESNRLEVALTIMRNPTVKKYLGEMHHIEFGDNSPRNLREVLLATPEMHILFESEDLRLSEEQQKSYQFLDAIGEVDKIQVNSDEVKNFSKAHTLANRVRWVRECLVKNLETVIKPMNTMREVKDIEVGENLTLYEFLRRERKPLEIWRKIGLAEAYRNAFLTDQEFWQSDKSLVEIYQMLKEAHG